MNKNNRLIAASYSLTKFILGASDQRQDYFIEGRKTDPDKYLICKYNLDELMMWS